MNITQDYFSLNSARITSYSCEQILSCDGDGEGYKGENIDPGEIPQLFAPLLVHKPGLYAELTSEVTKKITQYQAVTLKMGMPTAQLRAIWINERSACTIVSTNTIFLHVSCFAPDFFRIYVRYKLDRNQAMTDKEFRQKERELNTGRRSLNVKEVIGLVAHETGHLVLSDEFEFKEFRKWEKWRFGLCIMSVLITYQFVTIVSMYLVPDLSRYTEALNPLIGNGFSLLGRVIPLLIGSIALSDISDKLMFKGVQKHTDKLCELECDRLAADNGYGPQLISFFKNEKRRAIENARTAFRTSVPRKNRKGEWGLFNLELRVKASLADRNIEVFKMPKLPEDIPTKTLMRIKLKQYGAHLLDIVERARRSHPPHEERLAILENRLKSS
jgi:hypothetical protein